MGRRDMPDAFAARVVAGLRRRLEREHGGNARALARELGMSQPPLWQLLNEKTRPSFATAEALARVERLAVQSVLTGPRELAAALAREIGVSEVAIQRVLDEPEESDLRPTLAYVDRMRAFALVLSNDATPPRA